MKNVVNKIKDFNLKTLISKNRLVLVIISFILLLIVFLSGSNIYFKNRIFPGVKVLEISVGGLNPDEAISLLTSKIFIPDKLDLISGEKSFELSLSDIDLIYDFEKTAIDAYQVYRDETLFINYYRRIVSPFNNKTIDSTYSLNSEKLTEYLQVVSEVVLSEPTYPSIKFEDGNLFVVKGSPGEILDEKALINELDKRILAGNFSSINLPLKTIDPSLTDEESEIFKSRAEKLIGKTFQLTNDYDIYNFDDSVIFSFLDYHKRFNIDKISEFIAKEISPNVERPPQNAVLQFEEGKVVEFIPAKDGLSIQLENLSKIIVENLSSLEESDVKTFSINIPVIKASPEITLNEVNDLGIRELLGRGISKFKGSIPGRVHNISLASLKFNGSLIPPGETLSFNNTVGDVSSFTGYKQAYIIKDGRTVLGDGGGVCQVSTTLFRAVLDAGLPITERRAHSYRVSYYEQESPPGLDATVFSPTTDLKFTNDTPGHLLIQAEFNANNYSLAFEIYGTSDGRTSSISKPITTSSIAPPEDLYIDDPSLPMGTIKQIDYKAWGAKVVFDYSVERNGEIITNETFVSNYRPWQAVFLRGVESQ